MNSSEHSSQIVPPQGDSHGSGEGSNLIPEPDPSMHEFFQLQQELILVTLVLMGIIFASTWFFYSLNTAINYLLGACAGVFYLRLLAKHVEQLGRQRKKLGQTRLAILIVLIVAASQLKQLEILPIFLGFLTYKASLIFYMLRTTLIRS